MIIGGRYGWLDDIWVDVVDKIFFGVEMIGVWDVGRCFVVFEENCNEEISLRVFKVFGLVIEKGRKVYFC